MTQDASVSDLGDEIEPTNADWYGTRRQRVWRWLRHQRAYWRLGRLNPGGEHETSYVRGWDAAMRVASWQERDDK